MNILSALILNDFLFFVLIDWDFEHTTVRSGDSFAFNGDVRSENVLNVVVIIAFHGSLPLIF